MITEHRPHPRLHINLVHTHHDFPTQKPLQFGILGAANIAKQFAVTLQISTVVRVAVVASRSAESAQGFASEQVPSQLLVRRGTANTVPFVDIPTARGNGFRYAAEAFAAMLPRSRPCQGYAIAGRQR